MIGDLMTTSCGRRLAREDINCLLTRTSNPDSS